MAGGGVGEAMLIGAAMGAGTGAVTSAIDKKDPLQGALMGAVGGAAMGGIGSALGGGASGLAEQVGEKAVTQELGKEALNQGIQNTLAQNAGQTATSGLTAAAPSAATTGATPTVSQMMNQASQTAFSGAPTTAASYLGPGGSSIPGIGASTGGAGITGTGAGATGGATGGGGQSAAQWMSGGKGTGFAPGLTNAQAYGAAGAGGISGIYAADNLPSTEPFPTQPEDSYSGPLSYFKYDPKRYKVDTPEPNVYQARYGMADGGIASLTQDSMSPMGNPVYPQSQQQHTNFASSPQMPNSMRSAMASDYDTRTNPSLGTELPMGYADGGGIGFLQTMHPGGKLGQIAGDLYGVVHENSPGWFNDMQPGGFMGASQPGRLEYEAKQRQKQEEEERKIREEAAQAAQLARNTSMNLPNMARGGIADLGSYSDGGRLLRGPGDGVSDSIPATIAGKQPARLADGEFVVPSRIVSELGNGSTDAGARRLYDMMDRVQRRRGTTVGKGKVAKNTRAYQELPA